MLANAVSSLESGQDWGVMHAADRDRMAWEAICNWPERSETQVVVDGVDLGHATRWFLWDKVGRAIRRKMAPECNEIRAHASLPDSDSKTKASLSIGERVRSGLLRGKLGVQSLSGRRRVFYCPYPYSRHARILDPLLEKNRSYEIVVPEAYLMQWPGAIGFTQSKETPPGVSAHARRLQAGMLAGLGGCGITLDAEDGVLLQAQLADFLCQLNHARRDLERLKPKAVLVPSDNTPPANAMVHCARSLGVPAIMMQHGMDCERHYLSEAYASHIASWGPYRRERYQAESGTQPLVIKDIGNPYYDELTDASFKPRDALSCLWVTRPHVSEKCYAPSRHTDEGLRIFDALVDAIEPVADARLVIKPHSFDYEDLYGQRIRQRKLESRVSVSSGAILHLLADAGGVITEDSTAGMDAMMFGKPLVHVHFADASPVMPFAKTGAALQAFSPDELIEAMKRAMSISESDLAVMREKQSAFLDYAVGPRDGQAAARFAEFVDEIVG